MALSKNEIKSIYGEHNPIKMSFLTKIKMLFRHPNEFFNGVKSEDVKPAFLLYLGVFIVFNILSTAVTSLVVGTPGIAVALLALPVTLILSPIFTVLFMLWMHLFVRLFGGKKGLNQTLKGLLYAAVPPTIVSSILGILVVFVVPGSTFTPGTIPDVSTLGTIGVVAGLLLIVFLWQLYLMGTGIGRLHGISTMRGIGAIIIGGIVLVVVMMILAIFVFAAFFASILGGLPVAA